MIELSIYLPGIIAAYSILLVGSLSPGPAVAMLIGIATSEGRTPALITTLGIALGSVTINILTMLGIGLILSQVSWGMSALRVIGSIYLLWLAYGALKKVLRPPLFAWLQHPRRPRLNIFWQAICYRLPTLRQSHFGWQLPRWERRMGRVLRLSHCLLSVHF